MKGPLSQSRRALVAEHVKLVEPMARAVGARYPRATLDDLRSAGLEGLTEAGLSFDPSLGRTFAEYARYRIKGAMLDAVRAASSHGHRVLVAMQKAGYFRASEEPRRGNPLADGEAEHRARLDEAEGVLFASMFAALAGAVARLPGEAGVLAKKEHGVALAAAREAVATLAEEEQAIVRHYYLADRDTTFEEVGRALGLSYKQVKTRHREVLVKLGRRLRRQGVHDAPPLEGRP
ncbi:MAG: sigma-70 family RNA polymerase sigma factor [Acidobacteria bacterium]|nr:sigma-70 family RNA polymerase sigma factor [Acidobacteriota bacterium]